MRNGSSASPTSGTRPITVVDIPHAAPSSRSSARYRSRASWRARSSASATVSGPTFGLPSRSPPIQVPKRSASPAPASRPTSARSSSGIAFQKLCSKNHSPCRISSTTRGRLERISSVCQSSVISSASASSSRLRSESGVPSSSRRVRSAAIRRWASSTVRRVASVGCAVRTSSTRSRAPAAWISASSIPLPSSCANASASDSRGTRPSASYSRRRRIRWCCSAMLTSWKNSANARRTAPWRSGPSAATASPSAPREPPVRASRARARIRSSSSSSSWPSCSTSTRPSRSPSRRTLARRAVSADTRRA